MSLGASKVLPHTIELELANFISKNIWFVKRIGTNIFKESQWPVSLGDLQSTPNVLPHTIELKLTYFIIKSTWFVKINWYQHKKEHQWSVSLGKLQSTPPHDRAGTSKLHTWFVKRAWYQHVWRISVVSVPEGSPKYFPHMTELELAHFIIKSTWLVKGSWYQHI